MNYYMEKKDGRKRSGDDYQVLHLDIDRMGNKQKTGFIYPLILTIWTITKWEVKQSVLHQAFSGMV